MHTWACGVTSFWAVKTLEKPLIHKLTSGSTRLPAEVRAATKILQLDPQSLPSTLLRQRIIRAVNIPLLIETRVEMAEVAGLTLGAMGLIGTFKDCIDLFGMIVSARSLTDDAEILSTKLDIEKLLLLQWADRVGLTEPKNYDTRLDDSDLNQTIKRVLESIQGLLRDGNVLRERYGLAEYREEGQNIARDDKLVVSASSQRLKDFLKKFNKLSLHTAVPRREQPISTRFKWVVKDKEKFTSLMNELSYFVSRLDALVPAREQSASIMTEEDLAQIRSIPQLKVIVKASTGFQPQIAIIAEKAVTFLNQGRVLDCLWFRSIDDRKTNINERHSRTLEWVLDPLEATPKWDNLAEWLRNGSGLYWLAGKAGSGKSTLMKYLSNHPHTTTHLKEWAGQSEMVTLQFFFYALGRLEQKSHEGMLRSLLFQSLDEHRDRIEHALPAMWKDAVINDDKDYKLKVPSIPEMQAALLRLMETVSADKNFWVLLDGLDEFEGEHDSIKNMLESLQELPNVKILVSSRPLPVFVTAFDRNPKMYLQDLTHMDIETYVKDSILPHPNMARLSHVEPLKAMGVVEALVKKASGVFLWVALACQSIRTGLDDFDTVPELMRRAEKIPPKLEDFFRQIIDGIGDSKRDKCARFLRLIFESQTRSMFDPIPTLGLAIVEEQGLSADFKGPDAALLSIEEMAGQCKKLEGRLRSRCSGLVEIQVESDNLTVVSPRNVINEDTAIVESSVAFLHRSLYEFLCTEGMWERDALRVDNACGKFEPHAILASLWTQLAGPAFSSWFTVAMQARCYNNALAHNICASATNCPPEILATNLSRFQSLFIVSERDSSLWEDAERWLPHQPQCQRSFEDLSAGIAIAAEMGMASLVRLAHENPDGIRRMLIPPQAGQMLDCSDFESCPTPLYQLNMRQLESTHAITSTVSPLLFYATYRPFLIQLRLEMGLVSYKPSIETMITTDVIKYLLERGHDPNERFSEKPTGGTTTPWISWLASIVTDMGSRPARGRPYLGWSDRGNLSPGSDLHATLAHRRATVTMLLVDAGAELGAPGTGMCNLVDEGLSWYISNASQRGRGLSVEWARSDDLWLRVRDKILSLRAARYHQEANS